MATASLAKLVVLQPIVRDRGELGPCAGGPTVQTCSTGYRIGRACSSGGDCPPVCVGGTLNASSCAGTGQAACIAAGGTCSGGNTCISVANACGDGDNFGDPGERVRLGLYLQNASGTDLTGVSLSLTTADPDIQCILDTAITVPSFPDGSAIDTRTLTPPDDPAAPSDGRFFVLVISPGAKTPRRWRRTSASFLCPYLLFAFQ